MTDTPVTTITDQEKTMSREEQLRRIAEDMFNSETRRGWIANNCSAAGDVDQNITEQKYVERFIERNKDRDIDELLERADIARPSNMLTAHESEMSMRKNPSVSPDPPPEALRTNAGLMVVMIQQESDLFCRTFAPRDYEGLWSCDDGQPGQSRTVWYFVDENEANAFCKRLTSGYTESWLGDLE
jgi:hypothetical protein